MSDAVPRRFPLIAMGFAVIAMLFAIAAVIVVLRRGDDAPAQPVKPAVAPISDRKVLALDVVKLQRVVEGVVEGGTSVGVRVKDIELRKSLGLEDGDIITAISGRHVTSDSDVHEVVFNSSMMNATTLYAEIKRKDQTTLMRWLLDGDLRQARRDPTGYGSYGGVVGGLGGVGSGGFGGGGLGGLGTYTPPDPDPLLDTIERIDDTHVKIPRATVDALLANPMNTAKGARVVPSIQNGKPNGFKLYAIRPSSVFARLGFTNGDTMQSINGFELTSADKALEVYTKIRDSNELNIEIMRRGKQLLLNIQITK